MLNVYGPFFVVVDVSKMQLYKMLKKRAIKYSLSKFIVDDLKKINFLSDRLWIAEKKMWNDRQRIDFAFVKVITLGSCSTFFYWKVEVEECLVTARTLLCDHTYIFSLFVFMLFAYRQFCCGVLNNFFFFKFYLNK